jgi:hypothetical protein
VKGYMIKSSLLLLSAFFALATLSGCNLWGGIDGPSGDAQILSSCRAAFDQGDYDTAKQCYQQLSANDSDIALSETAYAGLTQAGASMKTYASAFGKGNVEIGPAITSFAEGILAQGRGQAVRVAIWQAFNEQANIKDHNLQALVRFLGSLSFAAEILAETSSDGVKITKADLGDGIVTVTGTFPGILGGALVSSSGAATLAQVNVATPTYNMFDAALAEIIQDIGQLGDSGTFGTNTLGFASVLTAAFNSGLVTTSVYVTALTTAPVSIGE